MTVLKQRCRDHGVARWPYRKVKKLDTMINALETSTRTTETTETTTETPNAGGSGAVKPKGRRGRPVVYDQQSRLESVKRTRDLLITQPNSNAHLKVGKLDRAKRKRMESSTDAREEYSSGDERSFKTSSYATVGGASNPSVSNSPKRTRTSAVVTKTEATSAPLGGVLGRLLEAANAVETKSGPPLSRLVIDSKSRGRETPSEPSPGSSNASDQMPFPASRSMFQPRDFLRAMPIPRTSPAHVPANIVRPVPRKFNTETVLASLANQMPTFPSAGGFQAFWHSLLRFGASNPSTSHHREDADEI